MVRDHLGKIEMRSASVVDRECWQEAGHAVVGHYLGMTIVAIGFEWVRGNDAEPNPATWLATLDGFEQDIVATQLFAGRAAEIIKVGDYDFGALGSDYRGWETLGCQSSDVHYTQRAIEILIERDVALVRVYDKLMAERTNASREPVIDSDGVKSQVHLTQDEFESLVTRDQL
jgi:hypothetical protein